MLVEGALPGERAHVEVTHAHKTYLEARFVSADARSQVYVTPRCPYFGRCGGCQLQHLGSDVALREKGTWFLETLRRVGRWPQADLSLASEKLRVHSAASWHYRRRIRLHFDGIELGFFGKHSNRVVGIDSCAIASKNISDKIPALARICHAWKMENNLNDAGCEIEVTSANDEIFCEVIDVEVANDRPRLRRDLEDRLATLQSASSQEMFSICERLSTGEELVLSVHRKSFVQPHVDALGLYLNEVNSVVDAFVCSSDTQQFEAWDLYAGSGLFSRLPSLASRRHGKSVRTSAVEGISPASQALKSNTQGLQVESIPSDVHAFVREVARDPRRALADIVIADPPRAGLGRETTELLCKLARTTPKPRLFVLVACDGAAFARDAATLLLNGWRLSSLCVFDTFAQTPHYETIASFVQVEK